MTQNRTVFFSIIFFCAIVSALAASFTTGCGDGGSGSDDPTATATQSAQATPTWTPTGATPTASPTPGSSGTERIVFHKAYSESGGLYSNIYSMKNDGSSVMRLTNLFPYTAMDPVISSDGLKIAMTSNFESFKSANYNDIFTILGNGANLSRITGNAQNQTQQTGTVTVSISDGTGYGVEPTAVMISFQGCENLTMLNSNWSTVLTGVPATTVWIKAVFNQYIGGLAFVTVPTNSSTSVSISLTDGNYQASQPAWSPDGTKLAGVSGYASYDSQNNPPAQGFDTIALWSSSGTALDDYRNGSGTDLQPRFSPDGGSIAFSKGPYTQESIVVVPSSNLNGSSQTIMQGGYNSASLTSYGYTHPDWSPNGSRIAATYTVYTTSFDLFGNIFLKNSNGSGSPTQLTTVASNAMAIEADFSPDGEWITYSLITSRRSVLNLTDLISYNFTSDIYKIRISGGQPVRLTSDNVSGSPCWGVIR